MTDTLPCPLCGSTAYPTRRVGSNKFKQALHTLMCVDCSGVVVYGANSIVEADKLWNAAGAHSQALRDRIRAMDAAMDQVIHLIETARTWNGGMWEYHNLRSSQVRRIRELLTQAREQK